MKSRTTTLRNCEVKEVFDLNDCPPRGRDWDFEGSWQALCKEIETDVEDGLLVNYVAYLDDTGWIVWRERKTTK